MKTCTALLILLAVFSGGVATDAGAYTQPAAVVDAGGGLSSSAGYENLAVIGQSVTGLAAGPGGSTHAGFIPALGGYGLLWPVIGFDPARFSFTFYLGEPAPADQGITITNNGGSTLEWTVARTAPWLTLTPLSGTNGGSVSIGILTAGLTPGSYHDTITISATGAENSGVTIPVTLTVGTDYTLTVTFASPTTPRGGGYVAFSPAPTIGSATCTGVPCAPRFPGGTPVTVTAYPDADSLFSSWSGACSGGSCSITMSADRGVTATFSYVRPAMIEGTNQYFDTITAAYGAAKDGQTIRTRQYTFVENLSPGESKKVTIRGGYAPNYADRPGYTLLQGKLTVGKGTLVTDRLQVK